MSKKLFVTKDRRTLEVTFIGNSIENVRELGFNEAIRLGDYSEWTYEQELKMRRFVENFLH